MSDIKNSLISLEEGDPIECPSYREMAFEELNDQEIKKSYEKNNIENLPPKTLSMSQINPPLILYKKDNLHYCRVNFFYTDTLMKYFIENGKEGDIFKFELSNSISYNYQDMMDVITNEKIYRFIDFIKYLKDVLNISSTCVLNTPLIGELGYLIFVCEKIDLGEMGYLALGYNRLEMKDDKWEIHKIYVKMLLKLGIDKKYISDDEANDIIFKKANIILDNNRLKLKLSEDAKKLEEIERDKINVLM